MKPKFNFGDLVIGKYWARPIVVEVISRHDDYFAYSDSINGQFYTESILELYEEPKPKKLYAYVDNDVVILSAYEGAKMDFQGTLFTRIPMYDIEYPLIRGEKK